MTRTEKVVLLLCAVAVVSMAEDLRVGIAVGVGYVIIMLGLRWVALHTTPTRR